MKIKRQKKAQKRLGFYVKNFGFTEPYQILIDGTYAQACLQSKSNVIDLNVYLQSKLKFLTTPCAIMELEKLGNKFLGAQKILKEFPIHKCSHEKLAVTGFQCFKSMIKYHNKNRYIIATQDKDLQRYVRTQASVPLIYLKGNTPILDRSSRKGEMVAESIINKHLNVQKYEADNLEKLLDQNELNKGNDERKKKRKRAKGPNPLSCKKKSVFDKRKRKDNAIKVGNKIVRIPDHVKDQLLKELN